METMTHKPGSWCGVPGCPCGGKPRERASVPDPIADTARALAEKWRAAVRDREASIFSVARGHYDAQRVEVEDAARACGPQVEAAFRALVTGDAGREVGNG